jgi:anti-anti-sigma factor
VRRTEVDLSKVDFLDSSGVSLLLRGRRQADEHGVAYQVIGAQGIARQVLEMTGVWDHLCEPDDSQPVAP